MSEPTRWIESETLDLFEFANKYGKLRIPSYQRGYEWNAYNVQRLVYAVFDGIEEETFLGTMQIALDDGAYYIVDGRQRLTTLALFHAVLAKKHGSSIDYPLMIDDPRLEEAIKEISRRDFKALPTISSCQDVTRLNRQGKDEAAKIENVYLRNAAYIYTILESKHFKGLDPRGIERMFKSIFIIAVSIQNRELTQVIRIFDTLNSTGQELSDEAMFKLRFHSYLRSRINLDSSAIMDSINRAYAIVDAYNASSDKLIPLKMNDVLWGYRTYLLTFAEIRKTLQATDMALGGLSFFEALFSKELPNLPILSLEGFRRYIELHIEYYHFAYPADRNFHIDNEGDAINRVMLDLLWWTRYGRTWVLPVAFYARLRDEDVEPNEAYLRAVGRAKAIYQSLYFYSVIYQKGVKHVKTSFLFKALEWVDEETLYEMCEAEIEEGEKRRKGVYASFWDCVENNFYSSYGQAYAFLAVLEFKEAMHQKKDFGVILEKVFSWIPKASRSQIEHIYCRSRFIEDPSLTSQEKGRLNGLGNFVLLEEKINKSSLKEGAPSEKFARAKDESEKAFFPQSEYAAVAKLCDDYGALALNKDYDDPRKWLEVVKKRYEEMKESFISLFPLLGKVE